MTNILSLQNDIAPDIARELKAELLPEEEKRIKRRQKIDPFAYDMYLKSNHAILEYSKKNNEQAIRQKHILPNSRQSP